MRQRFYAADAFPPQPASVVKVHQHNSTSVRIRQGMSIELVIKFDTLHAIVLVGYDETHVYANDPHFALSPQVIPIGDFDLAWLEMGNRYIVIELVP